MGSFLLALVPLLGGLTQPLKDYFNSKAEQSKLANELEIAKLNANKEAIVSGNEADTTQRSNYLNSVSQSFRQGIFYWFSAIIAYSILRPASAQEMWHNFGLIPQWVQYAYLGMVCVAWGLPIAKENIGLMFGSVARGLAASREYRLNRAAVFDAVKAKWFPKGMNAQQVKDLDSAIDLGEQK
jgi:hypothetical protein